MEKREPNSLRQPKAAKISSRVLVTLIAVVAVVFGAFRVIGYEMPYDEDPNFNAPLLTDVLLWFVYVLTVVALATVLLSVVHGVRSKSDDSGVTNGVPAARIFYFSLALPVLTLIVTFALGSTEPLLINGKPYSTESWLRVTDMFINTSLVLIVVAILAVAYGLLGLNLRHGRRVRKSR